MKRNIMITGTLFVIMGSLLNAGGGYPSVTVKRILNGYEIGTSGIPLTYQVVNPDGTPASYESVIRAYECRELNLPLQKVGSTYQGIKFTDPNGNTQTYTPSGSSKELVLGVDKNFVFIRSGNVKSLMFREQYLGPVQRDDVQVDIMNLSINEDVWGVKNPNGSIDPFFKEGMVVIPELVVKSRFIKKIGQAYQTVMVHGQSHIKVTEGNTFGYLYTPSGGAKRVRLILHSDGTVSKANLTEFLNQPY